TLFRSPLCHLIITLVPFPNSLCTSILPPCDSTISFEMASPSPEPPFSLDRDFSTRYNRSNIYGRSFLGIPSPSSVKVMLICLAVRSEEHTSELQSRFDLVCRLLLEKKN